jgi:hypothetical protein
MVIALAACTGGGDSVHPQTPPAPSDSSPPRVDEPPGRDLQRFQLHVSAVRTIRLGRRAQVTSVLSALGTVWVTAFGGVPEHRAILVDARTMRKTGVVSLGGVPPWETGGGGLRLARAAMWVAASGPEGSGARAANGVVYRIGVTSPHEVKAFPIGGRFGADVAIGSGWIWAALFTSGRAELVRLDERTGRVTMRVRLDTDYVRRVLLVEDTVVVDERYWEGEHGGPYTLLESFDAFSGRRLATWRPRGGRAPQELAHWKHELWAGLAHSLVRLDPRTFQEIGTPIPGASTNGSGLAGSRQGIWFVEGGSNRLSLFDPRRRAVMRVLDVRRFSPVAMDVGRHAVWLLGYEGTLTRIEFAEP